MGHGSRSKQPSQVCLVIACLSSQQDNVTPTAYHIGAAILPIAGVTVNSLDNLVLQGHSKLQLSLDMRQANWIEVPAQYEEPGLAAPGDLARLFA